MALFVDLVALSNGLHGSVQMDLVALFSWIGWLRHHGIFTSELLNMNFMVSNYISIPEEVKVKDIMLLLGNENCNYVKNKYGNIYQFVEKLERQTVKKLSSGEKKVVEIFSSLALHKKYLLL